MFVNQNDIDGMADFFKEQNRVLLNLKRKVIHIFNTWCKNLKNSEELIELLWGFNRTIMPFCHMINGKQPDLSKGADPQKGYGLDGLLEIKNKARKNKKDDLIGYIIRQDYLKYIKYCMESINKSNLISKLVSKLKKLTILIEIEEFKNKFSNKSLNKFTTEDIKALKLYSDEIIDEIFKDLVAKSLDCLKILLKESDNKERLENECSNSQIEIDLHIHSHYSDCSSQSVGEIICKAKEIGLKTISLTDHNNFEGVCKAIKIGAIFNINVIPGIEVATGIKNSYDLIEDRRDILIYFPDLDNFKDWMQNGLDSYTNDLLSRASDRIHNKKFWGNVPVEEVIEWADKYNGISILAHLGYYNFEKKEKVIELLKKGLDGIEIFNLKYTNYTHYQKNSLAEVIKLILSILKEFIKTNKATKKPLITIGSDAHMLNSIGNIELNSHIIKMINSFLEVPKVFDLKESDNIKLLEHRILTNLHI